MNTESCDCRRVAGLFTDDSKPGDFIWGDEANNRRTLFIFLPGSKHPDAIEVQRGEPGGNRVWGWDGNEDSPTLTPSIHDPGCWHGYLTNGRLQSC